MCKDIITISLLAIAGGIFALLVCKVQAYVLVTPIMGIIVGQAAHALGAHKKMVNRLIVLIILTFLVVLPYVESHPKAFSNMKFSVNQKYDDLLKAIDRLKTNPETKIPGTSPVRRNGSESAVRRKATS